MWKGVASTARLGLRPRGVGMASAAFRASRPVRQGSLLGLAPRLGHDISHRHEHIRALAAMQGRRRMSTHQATAPVDPRIPPPSFTQGIILKAKKSALLYALNYLETADPRGEGIGDTLKGLSAVHFQMGQVEEAHAYLVRAISKQVQFYGRESVEQVADSLQGLAGILSVMGRPEEAIRAMERLLSSVIGIRGTEQHEDVVRILRDVARGHGFLGQHQAKKDLLARAADIQRRMYGRDYEEEADYSRTLFFLASAHVMVGEVTQANTIVDGIITVLQRRNLSREQMEFVSFPLLFTKALLEGELGRPSEKQAVLADLLSLFNQLYGDNATVIQRVQHVDVTLELAMAAADNQQHDVARKHLADAEATLAQAPADLPKFSPKGTAALVYGKLGEREREARLLREVLEEVWQVEGPAATPTKVMVKRALARSLRAVGGQEQQATQLEAEVEAMARELGSGRFYGGNLELDRMGRQQAAMMLETLGENYVA